MNKIFIKAINASGTVKNINPNLIESWTKTSLDSNGELCIYVNFAGGSYGYFPIDTNPGLIEFLGDLTFSNVPSPDKISDSFSKNNITW